MNQVTDGDIRRTPQFAEYAKKFPELSKFIPRDTALKDSSISGGGTSKGDAGREDSKRGGAERR